MFFGWRFAAVLTFVFLASAAAASDRKKEVQSQPLLGTVVSMEVCYSEGAKVPMQAALRAAWQRIREIHQRMNLYDAASDVSLLNKAAGQSVKVHPDVIRLIQMSQKFGRLTGGTFDVTIGPL